MDPVWLSNKQNNSLLNSTTVQSTSYQDRLEALDSPMRAFLICLYSMTSMLAFVGNIIVIVVEILGKRSAKNLRVFLINLAVSDILIGVFSVPFTYTDFMLGRWIFPGWLCPFAQFVQILSVFVTTFTLTVIGIERYFAILFPLSNNNQWFTSRCHIVLTLGWILGGILGHVAMKFTTTIPFRWNNQTYYDCRLEGMDYLWEQIYNTSVFILTFAIPLLIQSYSYASIGRKLLKDKVINNRLALRRNSGSDRDKAKIIRMLIAVVIVFSICWLPIKTFMLLLAFWPNMLEINDKISYYTYIASFFFCHWLAMANSFVNPIIYSFMSKSFRADFKDVLLHVWNLFVVNPSKPTKHINRISRVHTEKTIIQF
ncbi:trissin receptor-like [Oppia nitens]|uniref:trissin receptor-like n=1 Tax=Oppia nitens TaxID=1686743 RepID=UPI0023DC9C8F|nr:trissin receptor-like [Oppia nitens]